MAKEKKKANPIVAFGLFCLIGWGGYQLLMQADKVVSAPDIPMTLENAISRAIDYDILDYAESPEVLSVGFKWVAPARVRLNLVDEAVLQAACAARDFGYVGRQNYSAMIEYSDALGNVDYTEGALVYLAYDVVKAMNCGNLDGIRLEQIAEVYQVNSFLD